MWPSGSLDTRPRGVSHATPPGGCYDVVSGLSSAHAGARVTPDRGVSPTVETWAATTTDVVTLSLASSSSSHALRAIMPSIVPAPRTGRKNDCGAHGESEHDDRDHNGR